MSVYLNNTDFLNATALPVILIEPTGDVLVNNINVGGQANGVNDQLERIVQNGNNYDLNTDDSIRLGANLALQIQLQMPQNQIVLTDQGITVATFIID